MPFCMNCGSSSPDEANFCGNCGTKLDGSTARKADAAAAAPGTSQEEITLWEGKPAGISDRVKDAAHVNSTSYTVTTQRIIIKSGLIGKKVEEIELLKVKDLSVKQSIPDRVIGIGSITVFSDDKSTSELILDDIKDVHTVKDLIRKAVRDEKNNHNITYREHL